MHKKIIIYLISIFFTSINPGYAANLAPASYLEPLGAHELARVAKIIKADKRYSKPLLFTYVSLQEPAKTSTKFTRDAIALLFNPSLNELYKVIVSLRSDTILSWTELPNTQPIANEYDYSTVSSLVNQSKEWQEALKKRGINNPGDVNIVTWVGEPSDDPALRGHRLMRGIPYFQGNSRYIYGRPIEGLSAFVDLTTRKVQAIDTHIVPIAKDASAFDKKSIGKLRTAPNPVVISQPKGYTFHLKNHHITWQKWNIDIGFNPRDGVFLHHIEYFDQGVWRPVIYRLSLSDIFVPYGDTDPQWQWRHALDAAEYGLGYFSTPLQLGIDVPENAHLMNMPLLTNEGEVENKSNIIALYEAYGGISWKHYDAEITNTNAARRAQNLVISSSISVSNYDYIVSYIFKQDGSIEVVVHATGIMLPKGLSKNTVDHFAHQVTKQIAAPHHQHFFNFRIDFDVDGTTNTVFEQNTHPMPLGSNNPKGNGFMHEQTLLKTSSTAQRNMKMNSDRFWVVVNPDKKNTLGNPVGYGLIPINNTIPHIQPNSTGRQMANFINYHFWVTPYDPEQMNATGLYPVLKKHSEGLEEWARQNKPIENTDLVVWYTMGVTHIPRPEEWPVMPLTEVSFKIIPLGFFTRNPALDLP